MITRQTFASKVQSPGKLIDPEKLKKILQKKLKQKIPNPEQVIKDIADDLMYQIQKTQEQVGRQSNRQQRIRKIQQQDLKARKSLNQKIFAKIQKSSSNKLTKEKGILQKKVNVRKIKQELVQNRLKQIRQKQFKERIQKIISYKSQSNPNHQNQQELKRPVREPLIVRSKSMKSVTDDHVAKSKQLEELQYFKTLQKISKRKIYDKPDLRFRMFHSVDKLQASKQIKNKKQNKFIQTLGKDLQNIEEARQKKEKALNQRLQVIKKQTQLDQEQLSERMQNIKRLNLQKLSRRKQAINKKNERFGSLINNSTPLLKRNWSSNIESSGFEKIDQKIKLGQTLTRSSINDSIKESKAQEYLQKDKDYRIKVHALAIVKQVIKGEKISLLLK